VVAGGGVERDRMAEREAEEVTATNANSAAMEEMAGMAATRVSEAEGVSEETEVS